MKESYEFLIECIHLSGMGNALTMDAFIVMTFLASLRLHYTILSFNDPLLGTFENIMGKKKTLVTITALVLERIENTVLTHCHTMTPFDAPEKQAF